ncbi:MATE family efflux transporter, partial [Acinetobacter baumannii]
SVIFAVAQAVSVRMGHKIGEKNLPAANNTSRAGVMISAIFMFIVALFYWFLPSHLIAIDFDLLDPKNADVIRYTRYFLMVG